MCTRLVIGFALALAGCAGVHDAEPMPAPVPAALAVPPPLPPPAEPAPAPTVLRDASVELLTRAIASKPIVLLGEVHDNAAQHALRLQALRNAIEAGLRPAIAFEQFDRSKQEKLDEARRETEGEETSVRVQHIVDAAGAHGWKWEFYKPYVALALEYKLPIVAANLSRVQAMHVAIDGPQSVFDANEMTTLGLNTIDPDLEKAQQREIEEGHCGRLPTDSIGSVARAQIARDAVLTQSILPYFDRGVILLTGNGHARRDIGIPVHLSPTERAHTVSIGLLENDERAASLANDFDVALRTPVQARKDPCLEIPKHG